MKTKPCRQRHREGASSGQQPRFFAFSKAEHLSPSDELDPNAIHRLAADVCSVDRLMLHKLPLSDRAFHAALHEFGRALQSWETDGNRTREVFQVLLEQLSNLYKHSAPCPKTEQREGLVALERRGDCYTVHTSGFVDGAAVEALQAAMVELNRYPNREAVQEAKSARAFQIAREIKDLSLDAPLPRFALGMMEMVKCAKDTIQVTYTPGWNAPGLLTISSPC